MPDECVDSGLDETFNRVIDYIRSAKLLLDNMEKLGYCMIRLSSEEAAAMRDKVTADDHIFKLPLDLKTQISEHTQISPLKEKYEVSVSVKKDCKAMQVLLEVGKLVMTALGLHAKLGEDKLKQLFNDFEGEDLHSSESRLASIMYYQDANASNENNSSEEVSSGAEAHTDRGLLTVIYAPHNSGLQVNNSDKWRPADNGGGQLNESTVIIFPGALLKQLKESLPSPTKHRVIMQHESRHSIVLRLRAPADFVLANGKTVLQFNQEWEASHRSINEPSSSSSRLQSCGKRKREQEENKQGSTEVEKKSRLENKNNCITLRIKVDPGEFTFFKVNQTTKMEKVFRAFAEKKGVQRSGLRFILDGGRDWLKYPTVGDHDLEDQDTIDCLLEQAGD